MQVTGQIQALEVWYRTIPQFSSSGTVTMATELSRHHPCTKFLQCR